MKAASLAILLPLSLALATAACGASSGDGDGDGTDAGADDIMSIELSPPAASLQVLNGVQSEQNYTVTATLITGEVVDVTAAAVFSIDNTNLGTFNDAVFRTSGAAGGLTKVRALYLGQSGTSDLTIVVNTDRLEDGVPANAADLFDAATADPALATNLVYPPTQAYVPPNLGDFEAHWTGPAELDLFEVSIATEYSSTRLFTTLDASAGAFLAFTPNEWGVVGDSARGRDLTVRVRGLTIASPATMGISNISVIHLTNNDIEGGIYYWASAGDLPGGIYRHDMSRPGESAEVFYTTGEIPVGNTCVACHVLSRSGDKMAVTYDGGNGAGSIVDVATRQPLLATDGTFSWNFASFEPDGSRIVTVLGGVLTLRDVATGAAVNTVPTNGSASHVDFAPAGDQIVYSALAAPAADFDFTNGSLVTQSFDAGSAMWGTPATIYTPPVGSSAYYPSFSPDGQWILFNECLGTSYDAATAELFVVKSDGSAPPIKLDSPNVATGLTNSWARWAPFEQELHVAGALPESFFWLTFSSKRAFGVRLPAGSPQLWMTPFFPSRATAGTDPSAPAFRLPFQEISTNNHIAQWTTAIVPVD
jgi:hypothetical protein